MPPCSTPVMFRRSFVSGCGAARHLDREHVLVAEAGQLGDVVGVGEEVALGVAEVGAVEPDVGLVAEAVEHDPAALALRPAGRARSGAVQQRPVGGGELGRRLPVPGHPDLGPLVVDRVEARRPSRRRSSLASAARHTPLRSIRRRDYAGVRLRGAARLGERPAHRPRYGRSMAAPLAPPSDLPRTLGALASLGLAFRVREGRDPSATRRARSPPASRCSRACWATSTRSCRSSRMRCSPVTTSSSSASAARPRRA